MQSNKNAPIYKKKMRTSFLDCKSRRQSITIEIIALICQAERIYYRWKTNSISHQKRSRNLVSNTDFDIYAETQTMKFRANLEFVPNFISQNKRIFQLSVVFNFGKSNLIFDDCFFLLYSNHFNLNFFFFKKKNKILQTRFLLLLRFFCRTNLFIFIFWYDCIGNTDCIWTHMKHHSMLLSCWPKGLRSNSKIYQKKKKPNAIKKIC